MPKCKINPTNLIVLQTELGPARPLCSKVNLLTQLTVKGITAFTAASKQERAARISHMACRERLLKVSFGLKLQGA